MNSPLWPRAISRRAFLSPKTDIIARHDRGQILPMVVDGGPRTLTELGAG